MRPPVPETLKQNGTEQGGFTDVFNETAACSDYGYADFNGLCR
jgi:hypothetical protein